MRALVALDGSERANAVLEAVAPWLKETGSRAELLTVLDESEIHATTAVPPSDIVTPQGDRSTAIRVEEPRPRIVEDRTQAIARVEAETHDRLRALAAKYLGGVEYDVHVVAAHPAADAILAQAQELHADTIAMGTHGRGGLMRAVLGSVAQEVLLRSPIPVFVVRDGRLTPGAPVPAG
jgi:nucleotide-binding universal stress UspA family protein